MMATSEQAAAPQASTPTSDRREPGEGRVPLSFSQERLWFLDQLGLTGSAYNIPLALQLDGVLDADALSDALSGVVARHESLRMRFEVTDGVPHAVVCGPVGLEVTRHDLSASRSAERAAEAAQLLRTEAARPFDLAQRPPVRALLVRLGETEHVLLVTIHHIVTDAWSHDIFVRELCRLYVARVQGIAHDLPPLPLQYSGFARWQRERLEGELLQKQLNYWKEKLARAAPALELPTDRARPKTASYQGAWLNFALADELAAALKQLAREQGTTLYNVVLTAFQVLLARYTGKTDILVGSPVAGRSHRHSLGLIGFFVNTLVMRSEVDPELSFLQILARVKQVTLGAQAHQELPFETLVSTVQMQRDLGRHPIFQVMFGLHRFSRDAVELPGLTLQRIDVAGVNAKFELYLLMREVGSGLRGTFEYATDLFEPQTIERLSRHFVRLLEGIVADPRRSVAQLPLLGDEERYRVLREWNATQVAYSRDRTLHGLFDEQVARTPDAVALVQGTERVSYARLQQRANRLARRLRGLGVRPESVVGLSVPRSASMVVGVLGILKAGGAYLPLDPQYPAQRLGFMLADARVSVLVSERSQQGPWCERDVRVVSLDGLEVDGPGVEGVSEAVPVGGVHAENLAYVMYTSGSTGEPKAIGTSHRNVVRLIQQGEAAGRYVRLGAQDVFLQLAPLSFDASTFELWGALLHGARLVLYPEPLVDLARLRSVLEEQAVSVLWLTAGLFHRMVDEEVQGLAGVRQLLAGGDVLSGSHARSLLRACPRTVLINGYGPTECTTFSVCARFEQVQELCGGGVPLGRAIGNTQVYVLDERLEVVPVGVPGELYIAGEGLSRGYLGRPGLTAQRFIAHPFERGQRLYRSGDRVRYLADGRLEFLGRLDGQVKVRGYRIEPAEIEAVLQQQPGVREAVVVARAVAGGTEEKRLVAYVVAAPGQRLEVSQLRERLRQGLPEYMVPAALKVLDQLPLGVNGKVDRARLPEAEGTEERAQYVPPATPIEQTLAQIWQEVLRIERVGLHDNFFELGGHSLVATRVVARVRELLGVSALPLRALFERPTVSLLGAHIASLLEVHGEQQSRTRAEIEAGLRLKVEALSDEEVSAMLQKLKLPGDPLELDRAR